jgi:hypothetical protein
MIFIDEAKIRTLLVATGVTKARLLEALEQVIADKGDKKAMCELWYDQGGIKCTFCGEGMFDGSGDHACEEVCNEEEGERIEFYKALHAELKEKLPETMEGPKLVDVKTYMENDKTVTEPGGLLDMIAESSFRSCWYKKAWNCCGTCGKVYFGADGTGEDHCLAADKNYLRKLREEVDTWLPG